MGKQYRVKYQTDGTEATLSQEEWDKRSRTSGVDAVEVLEITDEEVPPEEP